MLCIFTLEVRDGSWGGGGVVLRLPDTYQIIGYRREDAEHVLAARRREEAALVLAAAGERKPG
jgi:hypothetical protein